MVKPNLCYALYFMDCLHTKFLKLLKSNGSVTESSCLWPSVLVIFIPVLFLQVVSNIPFNISTDVVKQILPLGDIISEVVLLLQVLLVMSLFGDALSNSVVSFPVLMILILISILSELISFVLRPVSNC